MQVHPAGCVLCILLLLLSLLLLLLLLTKNFNVAFSPKELQGHYIILCIMYFVLV